MSQFWQSELSHLSFVSEGINLFKAKYGERLAELCGLLDSEASFLDGIHQFKGSASLCGLSAIAAIAGEIEEVYPKNKKQARSLLEKLIKNSP